MAKMNTEEIEDKVAQLLSNTLWRLNNLYWIQGLDETGTLHKMKFILNFAQEKFIEDMHWRNMILKSRQHGMSTLQAILILDQCLFNKEQTCGIIDKTDADVVKKLGMCRYAYDHLDDPDDPDTAILGAAVKRDIQTVSPTNEHNMTFANDSRIWASVSQRGGTIAYLWISELGHIAYHSPKKAAEIKSGALNTVHQGSKVVIESTHEGGKVGFNYEMIKTAQESPESLTPLDWKFHFFGWFEDPKNSLPFGEGQSLQLSDDQKEYFSELLREDGIDLTKEQKHWYIKQLKIQKDDMKKEHPSTAEEAINAVIRGAIYGKNISKLRKNKRIVNFAHDRAYPLWTFWDLGQTDYTSIGLVQFTGREYSWLDCFTWQGEDYRYYVDVVEGWERKYHKIAADYIPHDGKAKQGPDNVSWENALTKAGRKNVIVVPRTPDIWIGIKHMRSLWQRCWIHADNCSIERQMGHGFEKKVIPSFLTCVESYRTKIVETGARIQEMPEHDETSHTCDMVRTFSEAHARGMLVGTSEFEEESRGGGLGARVITDASGRKASRGGRSRARVIT